MNSRPARAPVGVDLTSCGVVALVSAMAFVAACSDEARPKRLDIGNHGGSSANGGSSGSAASGGTAGATGGAAGTAGTGGAAGTGGGGPELGPFNPGAVFAVSVLSGGGVNDVVTCALDSQATPYATPGLDTAVRVRVHPTNQNLYYLKGGVIRVVTPDAVTDSGSGFVYPDAALAEQNDLDTDLSCSSGELVDFVFEPTTGGAYLACDVSGTIEWYKPTGERFTTCDRDATTHLVSVGYDGSLHCNAFLSAGGARLGIATKWSEEEALAIRAKPTSDWWTGTLVPGQGSDLELWSLNVQIGAGQANVAGLGLYEDPTSCALQADGELVCIALSAGDATVGVAISLPASGQLAELVADDDSPPCLVAGSELITGQ